MPERSEPASSGRGALFDDGLEVRREVLGREYVDRAIERADDFSWPLQQLVTEYCWGTVWTRPGLPRQTRSLVNVAMLVALNRNAELRLHLAGAVRNGCSIEEIREVLLQTTIYVGVPAAVEAFRIAAEVFAADDDDS